MALHSRDREAPASIAALAIVAWIATMTWLAVTTGGQHDYLFYLQQWRLVLAGDNPWATSNAYGPGHNALAPLLAFGDFGPKYFIVATLLLASTLLAARLWTARGGAGLYGPYLLAIPTNVLVVGMGVIYGLNDGLVTALVIGAVLARCERRLWLSGALLGLAALVKYYPLFLILPFALEGRRLRPSVAISAAVVFAAGMALAYVLWGPAMIDAVVLGVERGPKLLSILNALTTVPGAQAPVGWLIDTNAYFVAAAALIATGASWWLRLHWLEAAAVTLLAVLLTYKTGHQQFWMPWLALIAGLPLVGSRQSDGMALAALPLVLFLSLYHWGYQFGSDGYRSSLGWVRAYGGFVAFPLGAGTLAAWIWLRLRARPREQDAPVSLP